MQTYTTQVANKLNSLLEKNYDAEKGYKTAAKNSKSHTLTSFFERKSNERERFGQVLRNEIKSFGEVPNEEGSMKGTAHRTWMNIKAFLTPENDEAMLEEALRGEQATIDEYNEVITSQIELPQSTDRILKNQRDEILKDALNIKRLDDLQKHVS
ncbi:ferritin-like domain-containing protein [Tenacibaculum sp. MEBiC06402]|uniref:ferritin-like domain-containing protein n=1 Tax=unclassified Tenacibaculum TaxID=2635139 RepID=UPI003B9A1293